jgi:hypothetical protein
MAVDQPNDGFALGLALIFWPAWSPVRAQTLLLAFGLNDNSAES